MQINKETVGHGAPPPLPWLDQIASSARTRLYRPYQPMPMRIRNADNWATAIDRAGLESPGQARRSRQDQPIHLARAPTNRTVMDKDHREARTVLTVVQLRKDNMETLTSLAQNPLFIKVFGTVGPIAFTIFFWRRVGSIYSILEHMWRLIAGKSEPRNDILNNFIRENRELERFRFVYGLKIRSSKQLNTLLIWINDNDLAISQIKHIWRWIKISDRVNITFSKRIEYRKIIFVFVTIIPVLFISIYLISCGRTFIHFKNSGAWLSIDQNTVQRAIWGAQIDLQSCNNEPDLVAKTINFSEPEVTVLCQAFKDNSMEGVISEGLIEQHRIGAIVYITGLLCFSWIKFRKDAINEAIFIQKSLDERSSVTRKTTTLDHNPDVSGSSGTKTRRSESRTKQMRHTKQDASNADG